MSAPGDLVAWRRELTKGRRSEQQEGYGLICEVGRGDASVWPITGPVTPVRALASGRLTGATPLANDEPRLIAALARAVGPPGVRC